MKLIDLVFLIPILIFIIFTLKRIIKAKKSGKPMCSMCNKNGCSSCDMCNIDFSNITQKKWFPARLNVHHGGADKKLDFSMMLNQDSFEMQEGSYLLKTF